MTVNCIQLPYLADSRLGFSRLLESDQRYGFLLDSGQDFSGHPVDIYGVEPDQIISLSTSGSKQDFHSRLQACKQRLADEACAPCDHPLPGWFGIWSYDLGCVLELNQEQNPGAEVPLFFAGFFPVIVVTDHSQQTTKIYFLTANQQQAIRWQQLLLANVDAGANEQQQPPLTFEPNWTYQDYEDRFNRVQDYIHSGDCYQINLTQKFTAQSKASPWSLYNRLRNAVAAPMAGFYVTPKWALISLSPERLVSSQDGLVLAQPIKGTRPRGHTPAADLAYKQELKSSEKDQAENLMIVDLIRNDLGKCCAPGSIQVDKLFAIESYHNVHHLVSSISGRLQSDCHPLDLLESLFPGGSVTGAPKHRAMEIINELEVGNRGFYCGSLFYSDVAGRMDANILIRSLTLHRGELSCWGGGGIVADSNCEKEYEESWQKVRRLFQLLSN